MTFWFACFVSSLIVLYGIRGPLPKSGALSGWWCPNMVTLLATILCLFAYFGFYVALSSIAMTLVIYTLGAILDAVDGRLARSWTSENPDVQQKAGFFFPGCSEWGALWDSSNDKLRIILIYSHGVWVAGGLVAFLFALIVLVEISSGIERIFSYKIRQSNGGNHSKWVGKIKAWAQQLCLIPWVFREEIDSCLLLGSLFVVLMLTLASPLSRRIKM